MAYIGTGDLLGENPYYESFAEYLYGTNGTLGTDGQNNLSSDITHWFNSLNDELRSTGRFSVLPIQLNTDGVYPQSIKDWNAYLVIYSKLLSRFAGEQEEVPASISIYDTLGSRAAETVKNGGAIFKEEIDAGELGIGKPEVFGSLGTDTLGTFFNNWRGFPYGDYAYSSPTPDAYTFGRGVSYASEKGFTGQDFPRIWSFEIDGAGGIGVSTFKWSKNAGKDYEDTLVKTDENWIGLDDNVYVRWGVANTGTHFFSLGDKWTFQTVPQEIRRTFGSTEAIVQNGGRGW